MRPEEAFQIIGALDAAWQDVPLRQDTIAIWTSEMSGDNTFSIEDALLAIKRLLHTSPRRPAYAVFLAEARACAGARRNEAFAAIERAAHPERYEGPHWDDEPPRAIGAGR